MTSVAIVDYGMGNLHSVYKALTYVAPEADIYLATSADKIQSADRVLLPGQGAIKGCMEELQRLDLVEPLKKAAKEKPFLGICIGPQLMAAFSEENSGVEGLGLFDCKVVKFDAALTENQQQIKIPHMGWNNVEQSKPHFLWQGIKNQSYFYYVHSYYLQDSDASIGHTNYGKQFTAAIAHDNIAGLQAHPEKSSHNGLQFLANFIDWQP